jgi:hypothetical protein
VLGWSKPSLRSVRRWPGCRVGGRGARRAANVHRNVTSNVIRNPPSKGGSWKMEHLGSTVHVTPHHLVRVKECEDGTLKVFVHRRDRDTGHEIQPRGYVLGGNFLVNGPRSE